MTTLTTRAHRATSCPSRALFAALLGLLRAYEGSPGGLGIWG